MGSNKIVGQLTYLRPLQNSDVDSYSNWIKDKEVVKYSLSKWLKRYSKAQMKKWLHDTITSKTTIDYGIIDKSNHKLIGHAGLCNISQQNKSAEYFILIGDKNYWSKGYGTEVTKLLIDYGFNKLGLHRIMLTVSDINPRAVKAYRKAGFKEEGILRDAAYRNGIYHNKIVMSILESEQSSS